MLNISQFFKQAEDLLKTGKGSHNLIKVGRVGVNTLIIRTGKERDRNLFGVKVVWLTDSLGRDQKYGIGPVGGYGAVGDRL